MMDEGRRGGKRGKFALASGSQEKRPIIGRKLARSTVHRTTSLSGLRSI